jgi:hypothetical protein
MVLAAVRGESLQYFSQGTDFCFLFPCVELGLTLPQTRQ